MHGQNHIKPKTGCAHTHNIVARQRNAYTCLAIETAWHHFTARERF